MCRTDRSRRRPASERGRVALAAASIAGVLLALGGTDRCRAADGTAPVPATVSRDQLRERAEIAGRRLQAWPQLQFIAFEAAALLGLADHEDAHNDAGGFARTADEQARLAVDRLEAITGDGAVPPAATLVSWQRELMRSFGDASPRADLEQRIEQSLGAPALRCSALPLAQAGAYLLEARSADADLGWRYADPYFRLAEQRLKAADALGAGCAPQ